MSRLASLSEVTGSAREAGAQDLVGGVPAGFVATPDSPERLGALLARCAEAGLTVVVRGAGTKLDWGGTPSRVDVLVDTSGLAGILEHSDGDLVARVGAGTRLRSVADALARAGQRLAIDPPSADATVGGMLATNEAGPLAYTYGTPRDLVIGIEFARADGVLAHSGGRVVKNVAGYDLGKLFAGSYGTLGVICSATFRLHPMPARRAWVVRAVDEPERARDLVGRLLAAPFAPTAIELDWPGGNRPGELAVLFEGSAVGVPVRCAAASKLLAAGAPDTREAPGTQDAPSPSIVDEQPGWWGGYPFGAADIALRLAVPVADLHLGIGALRDAAGIDVPVRGSAGLGVLHAALPGTLGADRVAEILAGVREAVTPAGGFCTVLAAPPPVRDAIDGWGPVPGLPLMRRVKEQFDPHRVLSPGRFVGGI